MKFLELSEFLNLFIREPQTLEDFIRIAQVKIGNKKEPLADYMKRKTIDISKIKLLLENIEKRNNYLTRFYKLSLSIDKNKLHITDTPMIHNEMNNNIKLKYKNIVRNIHYKDILQNTKSGIENIHSFIDVLNDLYIHSVIDYKLLTPSASHYIEKGRIGSVFSSYFFRASIMNPYLVYSLNEMELKGTKIFTPTLGWTSYCYGFLESPLVKEYVGTDVIPDVCKKTEEFAKEFYPEKETVIFCEPSENLYKNDEFLTKYREHFDVVFFSPPYYKLELYESENQSTDVYKTYEEWLAGYWEQTIQLCNHVLIPGGKMCYILSGYGSKNTNESYDLLSDMNKITDKYFTLKSQQHMFNKDVHVTKHKETDERIMIYEKQSK
jgi:hypothetical protein